VFVPQKPLAHCSKEMCKCDRPQGHLLTYTCELRGFLCCMLILPPASLDAKQHRENKIFAAAPLNLQAAFEGFRISLRETIKKLVNK
jgi:hypothetical protein